MGWLSQGFRSEPKSSVARSRRRLLGSLAVAPALRIPILLYEGFEEVRHGSSTTTAPLDDVCD